MLKGIREKRENKRKYRTPAPKLTYKTTKIYASM